MKRLGLLFPTFAALVALGSCASPPAAEASTGETISVAWREHIAAAKRKDLPGVLAMYADDMVYVVPGHEEVRGRSALGEMEKRTLAAMDVLSATHTVHALRVFGDTAYEISTIEGPVRARGEEAKRRRSSRSTSWPCGHVGRMDSGASSGWWASLDDHSGSVAWIRPGRAAIKRCTTMVISSCRSPGAPTVSRISSRIRRLNS